MLLHYRLAACILATTTVAAALPPTVVVEFPLTGLELLPFGGEYLLASAFNGTIIDAEVKLSFTATGTFQAENFVFEFGGPTGGVGPLIGGAMGWSGQGTFSTQFHTPAFNGEIPMENNAAPLRFWFMNISPTADSLPTPVQGTLGETFVRLVVQPCLLDWNGNFTVSVEDLFKFLEAWFGGQSNADIDGSGDLGVGDIFRYLSLYFVGCDGF